MDAASRATSVPPAHRHPDVRSPQGRPVIDAVASHGDDLAAALQRLNDPQLLCRCHPREHRGSSDGDVQLRLAQRVELRAAQHGVALAFHQSGVAGDRKRRGGGVSGDHDDAHAGTAAIQQGLRDVVAQRVPERDQADRLVARVGRRDAVRTTRSGNGDDAQALPGP